MDVVVAKPNTAMELEHQVAEHSNNSPSPVNTTAVTKEPKLVMKQLPEEPEPQNNLAIALTKVISQEPPKDVTAKPPPVIPKNANFKYDSKFINPEFDFKNHKSVLSFLHEFQKEEQRGVRNRQNRDHRQRVLAGNPKLFTKLETNSERVTQVFSAFSRFSSLAQNSEKEDGGKLTIVSDTLKLKRHMLLFEDFKKDSK
eukprot:TRINITY_DN3028_c0_g2_i2.p1 TRINITY_DN3028_c0_g2~~TRINITY_DN3028_c0_g2_i2.p1  ORF type:complete len:199 (+),score=28.15 TRINITY_DN3028_c0_g2_i2:965-1561(+)